MQPSMHPVALVTGGSRGIGRGIVLELARLGWHVAINYAANAAAAEEALRLARELGSDGAILQGDVGSPEARQRLIEGVLSRLGRLDALINNAGVAPKVRADLLEMSEESYDYVLDTNLKGPFLLTQLAARKMIELRKAGKIARGYIVNVSSISAYTASINRGEYCISKAGIGMMTALFADRLACEGINVYEIRPGVIATDMTGPVKAKYDKLIEEGLTPIKRWGAPEDIGRAVSAILRGDFPFSTGMVLDIDGGFHLRRL